MEEKKSIETWCHIKRIEKNLFLFLQQLTECHDKLVKLDLGEGNKELTQQYIAKVQLAKKYVMDAIMGVVMIVVETNANITEDVKAADQILEKSLNLGSDPEDSSDEDQEDQDQEDTNQDEEDQPMAHGEEECAALELPETLPQLTRAPGYLS